jgi:hypothetical protein
MTVHGRTYSPVDDARFKAGVPDVLNIFQDNAAVTLGLYDIHYDPGVVTINGGNFESLKTIVEEVAHTVQFLQVWADVRKSNVQYRRTGSSDPGYGVAKNDWAIRYAYYASKGLLKNGEGYKNDVEKWAKNRTFDILSQVSNTNVLSGHGLELCGFSLYGNITRPDY